MSISTNDHDDHDLEQRPSGTARAGFGASSA